MVDDARQAELLEQYLQALRQNPKAIPPMGLAPEMIEFAELFVEEQKVPPAPAALKARVWQTAIDSTRQSATLQSSVNPQKGEPNMTIIAITPPSRIQRSYILP